jgi:DNA repair exonuclease SbcCD ATPase subunit
MMSSQNKSTLFIRRFLIMKGSSAVYDQSFSLGVNIIRGVNSVGKSTLMDLIFYGLGGDLKEDRWTIEAASCEWVVLELFINGRPITICRHIEPGKRPPIMMFSGEYESSQKSSDWSQYGAVRTENKHSFSQQFFELLGWPAHKAEEGESLTMHQVLRLIYVDQGTAVNKILRSEPAFDKASMRQAIGEFLLGIDQLDSYELRQRLSRAEAEFNKIYGQLDSVYKFISPTEGILRAGHLENELKEAGENLSRLMLEREQAMLLPQDFLGGEHKRQAEQLASEIAGLAKEIGIRTERRAELHDEVVESELFIQSIDQRIKALQESRAASTFFGGVQFKYCPSCLSPLVESSSDSCHLCKGAVDDESKHGAYLAALNELNFQKRESTKVLEEYRLRLAELDNLIAIEINRLSAVKGLHRNALVVTSEKILKLNQLSMEIGATEERINNLKSKVKLISTIEGLVSRKEKLNAEISSIKDVLIQQASFNEERKGSVESSISELTVALLKQDGGYEPSFIEPKSFEFDFGRDLMLVDGRSKFSSSSETVVKNSFHLSVLQQSLRDPAFRYPRLLLMDNIEDKGMAPERSQNFQRLIFESMREYHEDEYQVIFTTSMIDPGLNHSDVCVGPFYAKGMHTLNFG